MDYDFRGGGYEFGPFLVPMHRGGLFEYLGYLESVNKGRIVDSFQVMVSTLKCTMMCEFGKGPIHMLKL